LLPEPLGLLSPSGVVSPVRSFSLAKALFWALLFVEKAESRDMIEEAWLEIGITVGT